MCKATRALWADLEKLCYAVHVTPFPIHEVDGWKSLEELRTAG